MEPTASTPAPVLVTGSADGLGLAAAEALLDAGHQVVAHVRSERRREAVARLMGRGAQVVVGDLADLGETRSVAEQANALGQVDAVIHNAGVGDGSGAGVLPVNVVAPYVLTALVHPPARLVYLSSNMHRGGESELDGLDWGGARVTATYSTSKLLVTGLAMAVARRWHRRPRMGADTDGRPPRHRRPAARARDAGLAGHQ